MHKLAWRMIKSIMNNRSLLGLCAVMLLCFTACKKEYGCTDPFRVGYNSFADESDPSQCKGWITRDGLPDTLDAETNETVWENVHLTNRLENPNVPDYVIRGGVAVKGNQPFTIDRGVRILMLDVPFVSVPVPFEAVGTAEEPILIEIEGDWGQITLFGSNNILEDVTMRKLPGSFGHGLLQIGREQARLAMQNCTLESNLGFCFHALENIDAGPFLNNSFGGSSKSAMCFNANNFQDLVNGIGPSEPDMLFQVNNWYPSSVTGPISLPDVEGVWDFDDPHIDAGLEVPPGSTIRVQSGDFLDIEGGGFISAVGTAAKPIAFQVNSDNTAGTPFWRGIRIGSNNPNNVLQYCEIQDVSREPGTGSFPTALTVAANAFCTIENNTFSGEGWGILIRANGNSVPEFAWQLESMNDFSQHDCTPSPAHECAMVW